MKLGLGTVQLGLPYGNKADQELMSEAEAQQILSAAVAAGIDFYDTAIAYGVSEQRLGNFDFSTQMPNALVSSKVPVAPSHLWQDEKRYWDWLVKILGESKARLKLNQHELLQFHQCDLAFLESSNLRLTLQRLLREGYCKRIGISVYSMDEALAALAVPEVGALQVPVNILDTRFLDYEFQKKTHQRNIQLIGRSALLQGVLVESVELPRVKRASLLGELRKMAIRAVAPHRLQSVAAKFLIENHQHSLDYLLIGVDSLGTLRQNIDLFTKNGVSVAESILTGLKEVREFALEQGLVDPRTWNLN